MCKLCCIMVDLHPDIINYYKIEEDLFTSQTNAWELLSADDNLVLFLNNDVTPLDDEEYYNLKKTLFDKYFRENGLNANDDNYDYSKYERIEIKPYIPIYKHIRL